MLNLDLQKAALRGVPSHAWRAGQERRLKMIVEAGAGREQGTIFVDGCGVGAYLGRLAVYARQTVGLDVELERTIDARLVADSLVCGTGEDLPFPDDTYDLTLSHEVLEHVQDDRKVIAEIIRTLKPGGRLVLFCPNRGYPFETHGIYWRGKYHFGNIPLVNYLPKNWRNRLAPHVRVYSKRDLGALFTGLPVRIVSRTILFGAYDNIIARHPAPGKMLRAVLQTLEKTPLRILGLSHFWIVEKN
jgi:SAM-dependent methyltransferase